MNAIAALLTVAGDGGADLLNVDDRGETDASTGLLTGSMLTGLGLAVGIAYGTLESLAIGLGTAGDTFTVQSTHAGTTHLHAGAGDDAIHVTSPSGAIDGVQGTLGIEAAGGSNTLDVSDTTDASADTIVLTDRLITGIATGVIAYAATGGSFAGGITVSAGSGGNAIAVESTHRTAGALTITLFNSGEGDDAVTVAGTTPEFLVINAGGGDDHLDATAATTSLTGFGAAGDDAVLAGSAGDVVIAGPGGDEVSGGGGPDLLLGDEAAIVLSGGTLTSVTTAGSGAGAGTLFGGPGRNLLIAGNAVLTYAADGSLLT